MKKILFVLIILGVLGGLFVLMGDKNEYLAQVEQLAPEVRYQLDALKIRLDKGTIQKTSQIDYFKDNNLLNNSQIIRDYADKLSKQLTTKRAITNTDKIKKVVSKKLINALKKESTALGDTYQYLEQRFALVDKYPDHKEQAKDELEELVAISTAADEDNFNDALLDTVNVLADLSEGTLKRVDAPERSEEAEADDIDDYGVGSQFVGNPRYGRWQSDQNDHHWRWNSQYSSFNRYPYQGGGHGQYYGGGAVRYSNWSNRRGFSYYVDIAKKAYANKKQRDFYNQQNSRYPPKQNLLQRFFGGHKRAHSRFSQANYSSQLSSRVSAARTGNFSKMRSSSSSGAFHRSSMANNGRTTTNRRFSSSTRSSSSRTSRTSGGFRGK